MHEILYSVTNRDTGFSSEAFPIATGFIPDQNASAESLRRVLRINAGSDDYFSVGILAAVRAFPVYAALLPENGSAVNLGRYSRPITQHEGGILTSSPAGPPRVIRSCSSWPPSFEMSVGYLADDAAVLRYDGKSVTIGCRKMGALRIEPEWPEDSGVNGRVSLPNEWTTGSVYRVIDYPVRFPYAPLAGILNGNSEAQSLLSASSLAGSFYGARSAIEKVALVAIALGRSNRRVYPDL
jgi:hypothetical protein